MASAPLQSAAKSGLALRDMPDWPSCLDIHESMAYSGLSQAEIQKGTQQGLLTWKAVGAKGRRVVQRAQLDLFIRAIFADGVQTLEDLDFGAD